MPTMSGLIVLLALALQAPAALSRLPVSIYPIVDHRVDSVLAGRLSQWLVGAFRRDTSLLILDRSARTRPRGPQPVYAVATDLDRAADRSPRLTIRVVDIESVNLVAVATVTGSPDSLQRALPAIADNLGERLRALRAIRHPDRPPPHWQVPTKALQAYSRALSALDRGDTVGAKGLLREALKISPKFTDACDALKQLSVDSSPSAPSSPGVAAVRRPIC